MTSLTVRPEHFTSNPDGWRELLTAMSAVQVVANASGQLYALGSGLITVRPVEVADPRAGQTRLALETADPLDLAQQLPAGTVTIAPGPRLEVTGPDGAVVLIETPAAHSGVASSGPSVLPLWMTPDVDGAINTLLSLGLQGRVKSDSGGWADFEAGGGGLVAVHSGAVGCVLSFESADVRALGQRLQIAGIETRLIDESYGLTLRLPDPDGGEELWVNETQRDLYGYHPL